MGRANASGGRRKGPPSCIQTRLDQETEPKRARFIIFHPCKDGIPWVVFKRLQTAAVYAATWI
jgi:hypothetical protein